MTTKRNEGGASDVIGDSSGKPSCSTTSVHLFMAGHLCLQNFWGQLVSSRWTADLLAPILKYNILYKIKLYFYFIVRPKINVPLTGNLNYRTNSSLVPRP